MHNTPRAQYGINSLSISDIRAEFDLPGSCTSLYEAFKSVEPPTSINLGLDQTEESESTILYFRNQIDLGRILH